MPSKRMQTSKKSYASPKESDHPRLNNCCKDHGSYGQQPDFSSIETREIQIFNSFNNNISSSSPTNNILMPTGNSTPCETPESLEKNDLLRCSIDTDGASSTLALEARINESESTVTAMNEKPTKRSAPDDQSEKFNAKYKRCASNDWSSEDDVNEQLIAIYSDSISCISPKSKYKLDLQEFIETQPESSTASESRAIISSPSYSSGISSVFSDRFSIEFSDQDDGEYDDSVSDIFGSVDHRITDCLEKEGPELNLFLFPELSNISDNEDGVRT
ncbi:uncharacterized protein LOC141851555 [Brevipalpus obovatus]|uniref:uncharacterized protein LOC141851555 n=1 Tax=Brevipalpus obovatus TaxID=246614 RepID=UPI003D9E637E